MTGRPSFNLAEKFLKLNSKSQWTEKDEAYNRACSFFGPSPETSILPYFCKKSLREKLIKLAPEIHHRLNDLTRDYFQSPQKYDQLHIPASIKDYLSDNKLFHDNYPIFRVDCFIGEHQEEVHIMEFNCADPSAFSWNDWILEQLWNRKHLADFLNQYQCSSDFMMNAYVQMMSVYYKRAFPNHKKERFDVHTYMPEDASVYFDFKCLTHYLNKAGHNADLKSPEDFKGELDHIHIRDSHEDFLTADGKIISSLFMENIPKERNFLLNPLSSIIGDQKSFLPYLDKSLPIIPSFHLNDDSIDLDNKDSLVLKPSNGYGGFDIHLGKESTQEKWNEIISRGSGYIVQRFHQPDIYHNLMDHQQYYSNFNFWVIGGQYAGAFVRISKSPIINFHQGGALLPVVYY